VVASQSPSSNRKPAEALYAQVVERYARLFDNPAARLRFLHSTLAKQTARQAELRQALQRFKFLEKTRFYDWIMEARLYSAILAELQTLMRNAPPAERARLQQVEVPLRARIIHAGYRARHAFYALGVVIAGVLLFGLYSLASWSGQRASAYIAQRYGKEARTIVVKDGQPTATPAVTTVLNHYEAAKVWLVEQTAKIERYSNNGQVNTEHEIDNHPRAYYLYARDGEGSSDQINNAPVGIVYHTTEGEQIPFSADNSSSIQERSHNLIRYIQRLKLYHYLIDRFGQIYRIVRDDQAANHAGYSLWADQKNIYVGLNESFIGIAFESSMAGSLEETLTEAQVVSGRQLTAILRSKYKIEDVNCTAHGLVSVNPDNGAIAFHHDWSKNFPFEAMGLSDKYKVPTPNMIYYGFTWDDEILEKLNKTLWPGAIAADEEFKQRAEKLHTSVEALRLKLRGLYREQYARQKALQNSSLPQNAKLTARGEAAETVAQ
jgi:hypothetical protein